MILTTFFLLGILTLFILFLALFTKQKWLAIISMILLLIMSASVFITGLQVETGLNSTTTELVTGNETNITISEVIVYDDIDFGFSLGTEAIGVIFILFVIGLLMFIVLG